MRAEPATLETIGGSPVLRFERQLGHSPERVWRAVTDPAELAHWFPARVETELRIGAPMRFAFDDAPIDSTPDGEILELDPPRVFAFRWGSDVLRWEIVPDGPGCRLVFSHVLSVEQGGTAAAGRNAAGWDECLDMLTSRLDERLPSRRRRSMAERIEAYVQRFGLGQGEVELLGGHWLVRFERDLVWSPADRVWSALTGNEPITVGGPPPAQATSGDVAAGTVTEAAAPAVLEYEWLHEGAAAGRVRWEVVTDARAGTKIVLVQSGPAELSYLTSTVLAAWPTKLEELFAALMTSAGENVGGDV